MTCRDYLSNNKKKKVQISIRNSFSNLPSGEQMNHCVPLAHYLACFAKQRTSGLRQRNKRSLGFCPFPMLLPPRGPAHKLGKRRRWWASGGASLRWFRQQRVLDVPSFSCFQLPRTEIGSYLRADHQRDASFHSLPTDRRDPLLWQMVICPMR